MSAIPKDGYVALKTIIAYRTGLNIRKWPRSEVTAAFERIKELSRREGQIRLATQPLNDMLLIHALDIAESQRMPD